ncbi:hypothetical protein V5O48_013925 [Marasmius crinis-equi]|uniref:Uncharacterized protein n=1 Tax=Marasmius crinis-equi TaxID=585013 RepID=A0ABR3EYP5_9AGAR
MCLGAGEQGDFYTRRLRNHKEFGGAWTKNVKNVVVPGLNASSILRQGQKRQANATPRQKDEEFIEKLRSYPNYRPKLNPFVSPLNNFAPRPSTTSEKPPPDFASLKDFLSPRPIPPPVKKVYVYDKTVPAATRKKNKKKIAYRNDRNDDRFKVQLAINDSRKKVAREKAAKTKKLARVLGQAVPDKQQKEEAMGKKKTNAGAWTGPKVEYDGHSYTISELKEMGVDEFEWDGKTTVVFRDENNVPIFVLGGFPDDTKWPVAVEKIRTLLAKLEMLLRFSRSRAHRRGVYLTISLGISFGGGQLHPGNFDQSTHNLPLLNELRADESMQQVARYMDHLMASYFPRLHALYTNILQQLQIDNPELEANFERCCFAALNINFGSAVTLRHTDFLNLLFGQCAVFPVGDYDYKCGGHLVLWDLKLAVQFPPGTVILLPSALLEHCNTAISSTESRTSVTCYSASGLFRWVTNGYMSDKEFTSRANQQMLSRWRSYRDDLWSIGLDILRDDF